MFPLPHSPIQTVNQFLSALWSFIFKIFWWLTFFCIIYHVARIHGPVHCNSGFVSDDKAGFLPCWTNHWQNHKEIFFQSMFYVDTIWKKFTTYRNVDLTTLELFLRVDVVIVRCFCNILLASSIFFEWLLLLGGQSFLCDDSVLCRVQDIYRSFFYCSPIWTSTIENCFKFSLYFICWYILYFL